MSSVLENDKAEEKASVRKAEREVSDLTESATWMEKKIEKDKEITAKTQSVTKLGQIVANLTSGLASESERMTKLDRELKERVTVLEREKEKEKKRVSKLEKENKEIKTTVAMLKKTYVSRELSTKLRKQ